MDRHGDSAPGTCEPAEGLLSRYVLQEGEGLATLLMRAHRGLFVAAAGLLLISLLAPVITVAAQDLASQDAGPVIANTGGDGAVLRAEASAESSALTTLSEGTSVTILDGPLTDDTGNAWYYIVANTGDEGYVRSDFVGYGTSTSDEASTYDDTAASDETPTEETWTDESTSDTTEEWSEETATEESQEPTTEPTTASSGIPTDAEPIDFGVVVDNADVEALPGEGLALRVTASANGEIILRLSIGERVAIVGEKVWEGNTPFYPVTYGQQSGYVNANYLSLESVATEPTEEVVTEVPTEEVVTEVPTEEVVTEVPTEEVVTEVPTEEVVTEVPAEEIVTEVPTEEVATEVPAEEVVTEVPTEEVVTEAPTEEVVTEVPTGEATAEAPTEEIVTEVPAEEIVTEVPAEEVVTEVPTEDVATEAPATADAPTATTAPATTVATETAAPTTTTVVTEAAATTAPATEAPATEAPATVISGIPTDAVSIGSATVTGTNGDGIRCRVEPANTASTIIVLPEGTKVLVYQVVDGGWLQIGCGDQLGYADVNYLWSGGASDDEINSTGGQLVVDSTGGLNCRSGAGTNYSVITVIANGTTLSKRGQASNGWTPVTCGGQNGYVSSEFLSISSVSNGSTTTTVGTGSATVSGTNGDGVRCRTSASTSGSIITVLAEGAKVTTRGSATGGWVPVTCGGQAGYVSSDYLTVSGGSSTGSTGSTGSSTTGSTVKVDASGGLNCRASGSSSAAVIIVIADGSTLTTRGSATNGWVPVTCGGKSGWVSADYVTSSGSGSSSGSNSGSSNSGSSTATGTAKVSGTNGDGVRCRASAGTSGSIITVLAEGTSVTLRGQANGGWQPVTCGGQNGYVSSQYLTLTTDGSSSGSGSGSSNSGNSGSGSSTNTDKHSTGDHVRVTADLNLRYSASSGAGVSLVIQLGTVIEITGASQNGFYPVNYDGLKGYASGTYLAATSAELSKRGGSADSDDDDDASSGSGSGNSGSGSVTGNALVDFAMGYLGYPYVAATHGPASFDCSGFTYWVVKNVLGKDIGTGTWTQVSTGTPVSRNSLQPGDLVFFQNTYQPGLSHVGIYIGNNQFIHAENETTGVRISDLTSTYYSTRWYGAVRLT